MWERQTSEPNSVLFDITRGDGQFVAVGRGFNPFNGSWGPFIQTSLDGVEWTRAELENFNDGQFYGVAYGNGLFVAVGWGYNSFFGRWEGLVFTSDDGVGWTRQNVDVERELRAVSWANGQFVVVGNDTALTSSDGLAWTTRSIPAVSVPRFSGEPFLQSLAYGRGRFIALDPGQCGWGCSPSQFWTSENGLDWTLLWNPPVRLHELAFVHGAFFAVGEQGQIWSSASGVNWSRQDSGVNDWLDGIGAGPNGTLLAVGEHGTILQSDPFTEFNRAPIAVATVTPEAELLSSPGEPIVIATNGQNAQVLFDGSLSSDPDNDTLEFLWRLEPDGGPVTSVAGTVRVSETFDLGEHVVSLIVRDSLVSDTNAMRLRVLTIGEAVDRLAELVHQSGFDTSVRIALLVILSTARDAFEQGDRAYGLQLLSYFQSLVRLRVQATQPDLAARLIGAAGEIRDVFDSGPPPQPLRLTFVGRHGDGTVELQLTGGDLGQLCAIEVSTDLVTWSAWITVTNSGGATTILDPGAATSACRFYRAVAR